MGELDAHLGRRGRGDREAQGPAGSDILVAGSRTLVQTLIEHDLVDEYRLMVFPIVLGAGKRLFGETDEASVLELVDSKVLESGTVILTYRPARA